MHLRLALTIAALLITVSSAFGVVTHPVITSINPSTVIAGSSDFTLQVTGANFQDNCAVLVNGAPHPTTFVDSSHLTSTVLQEEVASPGNLSITVLNPNQDVSSPVTLQVLPNSPTISSISPSSVAVHGPSFTLRVNGSNFDSTAVVKVNNSARSTTFVDSSTLNAAILSTDITSTGTDNIRVSNPNNHDSNVVTLTVTANATPAITTLDPSTVNAGSQPFTLSVLGTNFASGAAVKINGATRSTTFVSSTKLTAGVVTSDLASPGSLAVTVTNPGGAVSAPATLTVTSATQPTITSISPNTVTGGTNGFTLSIVGTNYVAGASAKVNASARSTTFVDAQHLTATILRSDIATAGTLSITVTNPGASGETSNSMPLTVVFANSPVITSLDPLGLPSGSPATKILVNGTGFDVTDTVFVNAAAHPTEFVSATQLAVTLSADDLASPTTLSITVAHTTGEVSGPATFNVSDASGPLISSISPSSVSVGGAGFTMTVIGENFDTQAVVSVDTTPRTTQFISTAQLTTVINASDLTTARNVPIAVINAGGVTSPSVNLAVGVNPPAISSVRPTTVIAGDVGFTLTVSGSGFSDASIINVNGTTKTTTFNSGAGTLTAAITADDIATPGTLFVTVTDSGLTSSAARVTVLQPNILSINPVGIAAGSGDTTLVVSGAAFLTTSKIVFLGTDRATTFTGATGTLSTTLTATDLASAGDFGVSVRNSPTATSQPFILHVVNPGDPRIDRLSPSFVIAGTSSADIHVIGGNFLPGSLVQANGFQRPTQYVSSSELIVSLNSAQLVNPGALPIVVVNPDASRSFAVNLQIASTAPPARRRPAGH
ncbi:MAG TPA: hypothetical protein VEZ11_08230 [Thermoanaerobaculia bacterium]|nr:hypothetical protein [Thermoanaerobaculia bacterium]